MIHPYERSIIKQYEKREKLFENQDVLPEFELYAIKAVQSIGGECEEGYKDWFEALEAMIGQIEEMNFEVALIGCGAYSLPLVARIKKIGKRWKNNSGISQTKKKYWIYPNVTEDLKLQIMWKVDVIGKG